MIVFTSDHGDYLGDHWMGEKDLFHEQSAKIPLIVIDPSASADATRGTRLRCAGRGDRSRADLHRIFRRHAARPHPRGPLADAAAARRDAADWRKVVFSEYDYAMQDVRLKLESADRAMPAVHGVRRPLEIHPRLGLPADALRSQERPAGIRRSRRGPRLRRRHRAAAGRAVRLGAASEEAHHHAEREDRALCRTARCRSRAAS